MQIAVALRETGCQVQLPFGDDSIRECGFGSLQSAENAAGQTYTRRLVVKMVNNVDVDSFTHIFNGPFFFFRNLHFGPEQIDYAEVLVRRGHDNMAQSTSKSTNPSSE